MNKTKKIALLLALPAFAFVLSGCGKQTAPASQTATSATKQEAAVAPQTVTQQQDSVASTSQPLPPLPADNKKAIDTELSDIDKELKTTDSTVISGDLSDTQLGL